MTIGYNIIQGLVSTWFGGSDETLALFGFGIDSFIEVISCIGIAHMILRFCSNSFEKENSFEQGAQRTTGTAFYMLTAGLLLTIAVNIAIGHTPETTF